MALPVSSYQELLSQVRNINQETQKLQLQLNNPLLECTQTEPKSSSRIFSASLDLTSGSKSISLLTSEPSPYDSSNFTSNRSMEVMNESNEILAKILDWVNKEQTCSPEVENNGDRKNISEVILTDNISSNKPSLNFNMWHSVGPVNSVSTKFQDEPVEKRSHSLQQLGAKVEMVYNLLSMLSTHDREEMTKTLLVMTSSPDSCIAMRKSGCLPLLVQLLHGTDESPSVKHGAAQALRNIVHCHADDKQGRREARVLRLLEQVREYYEKLAANVQPDSESQDDSHVGQAIAALMKLSFDEEHRHAMCQLGALQTISTLIQVDHKCHGSNTADQHSITLRRYAGMTMTNLTFGDGGNKSLLCSMPSFMTALVSQLESPSEDLRQVTASVLRNLSWRANEASKSALREVNAITALVKAAMRAEKESTLKSILSALWNFSAHSKENKADICAVEGCLEYLCKMLTYQAPSKTLSIIENAGGILRNVSCHIAVREDYRQILRENNCLAVLLQQLRSPSLTIVSNACGTLWNFSAHSEKDQKLLWDLGAVPLLRSLVHSKHKMISVGSSATLKNLLAVRPDWDPYNKTNKGMPGLSIRKRKAFEQELDVNLAETCDNIEVDERWDEGVTSPKSTSSVTQYAETDLDQPTNYSLRYAEDDTSEKIVDQEVPRTYYTEGTPCNISSATSVTDLRPSATDGKGICDDEKEECNPTSPAEYLHSNDPESQTPNESTDGKNVTLETPLMFSRASSLDSVSTPDHPDDRSSVISEFRLLLFFVYFAISISVSLSQPVNLYKYNFDSVTRSQIHNIRLKLDSLTKQFLQEKSGIKSHFENYDSGFREEIVIDSMSSRQIFIDLNVSKWLSLNFKKSAVLIGLQSDSFVFSYVNTFDLSDPDFSRYSEVTMPGQLLDGDVFLLWNSDLKTTTVNALLLIKNGNFYSLLWYQIFRTTAILHSSWSLPESASSIKVVQIKSQPISFQNTFSYFKGEHFVTVRIFAHPSSISANLLELRLLQTLKFKGYCEVPFFIQISLQNFLIVPAIEMNIIHIFLYSLDNDEIHFDLFRKLSVVNLKYVSVFSAHGFGFLLIVSDMFQVFRLSSTGGFERKLSSDSFTNIVSFVPLAVPIQRRDCMLIVETSKTIKVIVWNPLNFTFIESLVHSNDSLTISIPELRFSSSAVINFQPGVVWVVTPRQNKNSVFLRIDFHLNPPRNSVNFKLDQLISGMKSVQLDLSLQVGSMSKLKEKVKKVLNTDGDTITGVWSFESIEPISVYFKEEFSFDDMNVYNLQFPKTEELNFKIENLVWKSLDLKLSKFDSFFKDFEGNIENSGEWSYLQTGIVPKKFSGELKVLGYASFYRLTVTQNLNGHNVDELFENIVRLDKLKKIPSSKVFTALSVTNLVVNKIVNTPAESLLFDDTAVYLPANSFEFEELIVLNNVTIEQGGLVNGFKLHEDIFRVDRLFKGSVHFKKLVAGNSLVRQMNGFQLPLNSTIVECLLVKGPSIVEGLKFSAEYDFVSLSPDSTNSPVRQNRSHELT